MIRPIRKDLGDLRDVMVSATEPTVRNDGDALQANDVWLDVGNDLWKLYDGAAFQTIGGGGSSPLTTKGDLYTYDTDDARLPVGTDGQVLTADSGESTGLKWAASGGGGGSGALTVIDETVLTSSAADIDWTSIPATYRSLMVVVQGRSDASGSNQTLRCQFNGDTGSNYYSQQVHGNHTNVVASANVGETSAICGLVTAAGSLTGLAGSTDMIIPAYSGTTWHKQGNSRLFLSTNTGVGNQVVAARGWRWASTAAINRIRMFPGSGNFIAGTVATLYGMATA